MGKKQGKSENKNLKASKNGNKVEQSGNKNPKVRQEWEQTRDKVGTRAAKRGRTGNKVGTK